MNRPNPSYSRPAAQPEQPHDPNPFDFVPFPAQPLTRPEAEFDALGDLLSGYLELRVKALTPVHIVGALQNQVSSHYRQNGEPCIPAASLRGCLRAFLEALTGGWVSQYTPEYAKIDGHRDAQKGRYRGFATFDRKPEHTVGPAIGLAFKPRAGCGLDLASYLFGVVIEKEPGAQAAHADLARKSRVWIEDACLAAEDLTQTYWLPDLDDAKAFMGGPRPSASNWWYMKPSKVEKRRVQGGRRETAEFVGQFFRGRKFYFHQKPRKCLKEYNRRAGGPPNSQPPFWVKLEAMEAERLSAPFRIYLNRVPRRLAALLALVLFPGRLRHKIGYGKAYGYGSIEFQLEGAMLRADDAAGVPPALEDRAAQIRAWQELAWDAEKLADAGLAGWIDRAALGQLAVILTWDEWVDQAIFTYPPFAPHFFQTPVPYADSEAAQRGLGKTPSAEEIARRLYALKRTIHFGLFQKTARYWNQIEKRKP